MRIALFISEAVFPVTAALGGDGSDYLLAICLGLTSHKLGVGTSPITETMDFNLIFRFPIKGVAWRKRVTLIRNRKDFEVSPHWLLSIAN